MPETSVSHPYNMIEKNNTSIAIDFIKPPPVVESQIINEL
jgi:hypothetical protein